MAQIDNFKGKTHKLTAEEQSIAGKKSVESRRKKKELRQAIEALLEREFADERGDVYTGAEVLAIKLFDKAKKGDTRAFELIRDTAGQKPVEKIMVAEVEQSVVDEVERMVLDE